MTKEEIENKYGYDNSIWQLEVVSNHRKKPRIISLEQFWLIQELFLLENMKCNQIAKLFNIKGITLKKYLISQYNFDIVGIWARELQIMWQIDATHKGNVTYTNFNYNGSTTKLNNFSCPQHGDFQSYVTHIIKRSGCPTCGKKSKYKNTYQFVKDAQRIHGYKYDYTKTIYTHCLEDVIISCSKHGDFTILPSYHLNGTICHTCANEQKVSKQHLCVQNWLLDNSIQIEYEYRICKNPKTNHYLPYDFYLPVKNVIIEVQGIQHYERIPYWHKTQEDFEYQQWKDNYKRTWAVENNFTFVEIPYCESEEQWKTRLSNLIK